MVTVGPGLIRPEFSELFYGFLKIEKPYSKFCISNFFLKSRTCFDNGVRAPRWASAGWGLPSVWKDDYRLVWSLLRPH